MDKWEYIEIITNGNPNIARNQEVLNGYSKDGWRIINVRQDNFTESRPTIYLFERKIQVELKTDIEIWPDVRK